MWIKKKCDSGVLLLVPYPTMPTPQTMEKELKEVFLRHVLKVDQSKTKYLHDTTLSPVGESKAISPDIPNIYVLLQ